jgi:predicted alpha/beta-fold hydrolase
MRAHLETILPAVWPNLRHVVWARERWDTPDGDFIDLDWSLGAEGSSTADAPPATLLVIFHGLEGSSRSAYAVALAAAARDLGWPAVVVHFRGCSGELNRQPRAYHAGDVQEIAWILDRLASEHAGPLLAVGVSLGGNALMRCLGNGSFVSSGLKAAAALSAPLDLTAAGAAIDTGLNRLLYGRLFLQTMRAKALAKHAQFPGLFDLPRVMQATTLREFDDAFTAPLHGFKDVDHYWQVASAASVLEEIRHPALLINPLNDPLVPAASLPDPDRLQQQTGGRVRAWQPRRGGHVGFARAMAPLVLRWLGQHLDRR